VNDRIKVFAGNVLRLSLQETLREAKKNINLCARLYSNRATKKSRELKQVKIFI
jgi:hypothetical protein